MKAASGTRCGLMTPFFNCAASSSRMALGETSLPVPEVVGMQTRWQLREASRPMPKVSSMR